MNCEIVTSWTNIRVSGLRMRCHGSDPISLCLKPYNRTNSKARLDREFTAGLSWFKHDARRVIAKAFDLVALLEEHGYMIEIIRTERVGFIVYEDKNQVVAEPFSDTPT